MPTHDDPNHPQHPEAGSPGYEVTDVNVRSVVVFLASLGAFVGVFFAISGLVLGAEMSAA